MLEKLYSLYTIEEKPYLAFIMGFAYSIIGVGLAFLFFRSDPALVTVAFISLLLYPTIRKVLRRESNLIEVEDSTRDLLHVRMHRKIILLYLLIFLGVLIGFSFFSLALPSLATNSLFEKQIGIIYGDVSGSAIGFNSDLFQDLFFHNLNVLLLAFFTALLIGDGAIFLLVWNASVWGIIFGNLAKTAALTSALNPVVIFFLVLFIVLPHLIFEAISYILAGTAGGVISRTFIRMGVGSKKFKSLIISSIVILIVAIGVLAGAMLIEQYVLTHNELYRTIIQLSGLGS